jgi:hypothetical protein
MRQQTPVAHMSIDDCDNSNTFINNTTRTGQLVFWTRFRRVSGSETPHLATSSLRQIPYLIQHHQHHPPTIDYHQIHLNDGYQRIQVTSTWLPTH